MKNLKRALPAVIVLLLATLACNAVLPQTETAPPSIPTTIIQNPVATALPGSLPLTEDAVPRVSVEEAKVAFESGDAIIVDVRSAQSYSEGHVAGAINIPLDQIELNPASIALEKEQWIITYCT